MKVQPEEKDSFPVRQLSNDTPPGDDAVRAEQESRVLRSFFSGGRLHTMPAKTSKRLVVLRYIAHSFQLGRRYSEAEVNERLMSFYDDYCYLRRELVDHDLLGRGSGEYWRTG